MNNKENIDISKYSLGDNVYSSFTVLLRNWIIYRVLGMSQETSRQTRNHH